MGFDVLIREIKMSKMEDYDGLILEIDKFLIFFFICLCEIFVVMDFFVIV